MKCVKRNLLGLVLIASSSFVFADSRESGGGLIHLCQDGAELFDFYESKELKRDVKIVFDQYEGSNYLEIMNQLAKKVASFDPSMSKLLQKEVKSFDNNSEWRSDDKMPRTPFGRTPVFPKIGCEFKQVIVQNFSATSDQKKFIVNKDLWPRLSEHVKASLVLHESLYYALYVINKSEIGIPAENFLSSVRMLTSFFASDSVKIEDFDRGVIYANYKKANIGYYPYRHYFFGDYKIDEAGMVSGHFYNQYLDQIKKLFELDDSQRPLNEYTDTSITASHKLKSWLTFKEGELLPIRGNSFVIENNFGGQLVQSWLYTGSVLKDVNIFYQDNGFIDKLTTDKESYSYIDIDFLKPLNFASYDPNKVKFGCLGYGNWEISDHDSIYFRKDSNIASSLICGASPLKKEEEGLHSIKFSNGSFTVPAYGSVHFYISENGKEIKTDHVPYL